MRNVSVEPLTDEARRKLSVAITQAFVDAGYDYEEASELCDGYMRSADMGMTLAAPYQSYYKRRMSGQTR